LRLIRFFLSSLALFLIFGSAFLNPVRAQDPLPVGPVYIVLAGDTLSSIAVRFGVSVEDLVSTNQLADANSLFVGDRLVIPGLEGIEGVLETRALSYGDSFHGLARRYQIPPFLFKRLNRLVSPAELVVGAELVLPVSEQPAFEAHTERLEPGESLLELAVRTGNHPATIPDDNHLDGAALALPGDLLFVRGRAQPGPSGLPTQIEQVSISPLYQGETAVISFLGSGSLTLEGQLAAYPLKFVEDSRSAIALQGIHAMFDPGMIPLSVHGILDDGRSFSFLQYIRVHERSYIFEFIVVPPELIDPVTTEEEAAFVAPLLESVTREKYWSGLFEAPSAFADCINSSFGNRRSYNGSGFTYYHSGVDFCGGEDSPIAAPADGVVVFAGLLEIRGNFTLIDHGWGVFSAYLHQSEIFVSAGDHVSTGQTIGSVGSTGRSTGAHLHWEIVVGGVPVNPLDWLMTYYP